jgi:hypothetical protein
MPQNDHLTLRQLANEAARYAKFYFEHPGRAPMLADAGHAADAAFVVLARNQFVPLDSIPGCAGMLRKFVRGTPLDQTEDAILRDYWSRLDAAEASLTKMLETDGPAAAAYAQARERETWPAVGLAGSETELRTLMNEQFERMRRARIAWRGVDSSTYNFPMRGGAYVLVVWFWHGM